ncbi:transporter substrate-binding domain-containing protein [Neorhizobium sp. JUb45]|uniref:substrate-binding periplasmic protein n=1 Tax=unclassified Neorhizobium TaxID=2629175 RepID=UPI00104D8C83|nr:transporter substrate-binding domain-containing protein [Neorhizobium sp. JUb45]TCR06863.1 amino acid ABC transporter substrate-binding protein (PAAT family) [Neorhizobium sp. JUb45]
MKAPALTLSLIFAAGHAAADETLLFTTESYPPFVIEDAASPPRGISVDQIRGIMAGSDLDYRIEVMPWARAIALAETQPATCVFSAAQTPERKPRFKWVMPLAKSRSILVKHRNAGVAAQTIDEAKAFTVGTHRSDYTETVLQKLKFPKIDISSTFDVTLAKLLRDRIDLMPMSQDVYEQLHKRGVEIEKVAQLTEQSLGIACNRNVPWQTIKTLQTKLDRMIADGTQARIYRAHGLEPPLP